MESAGEMRPARQRAIQQGGPFTIPGDNGVFVSRLRNVFANSDAKMLLIAQDDNVYRLAIY